MPTDVSSHARGRASYVMGVNGVWACRLRDAVYLATHCYLPRLDTTAAT
jgi:hypothetical protein